VIAYDDEPMRSVLPATDVVRVTQVQSPAYRQFDSLSELTLAPTHSPWQFLSGPETATARALDGLGLMTIAVRAVTDSKRPDVVTADRLHRIELKSVGTASFATIQGRAREASYQARRVVLDLRGTALDRVKAAHIIRRVVSSSVGPRVDEVGLLVRGGKHVVWRRYE